MFTLPTLEDQNRSTQKGQIFLSPKPPPLLPQPRFPTSRRPDRRPHICMQIIGLRPPPSAPVKHNRPHYPPEFAGGFKTVYTITCKIRASDGRRRRRLGLSVCVVYFHPYLFHGERCYVWPEIRHDPAVAAKMTAGSKARRPAPPFAAAGARARRADKLSTIARNGFIAVK
ncbi:hypothetical protein Zmor_019222 [Zophobas morio]|uniref:Uncharacterized protein n=1 Tax=Zophobas morio TaxID=2755281 RepID=A0AA38HZ93_9CUCU|nr:hypothetical protein Zmor_019222 [Zophobas morio]